MLRKRLVERLSLNEGLKMEYRREADFYYRLWLLSEQTDSEHLQRALKAIHRIDFLGEVNEWIGQLLDEDASTLA
jgi:hypothetical protein